MVRKITKPAYDPAKRYAVTMARTVEREGFVYKPGPVPIEMSGELVAALGADVAEAVELPPAAELPALVEQVHEEAP